MLNKSGESGHPCLVTDLRGNAFSFLSLSMMLAVGLDVCSVSALCPHCGFQAGIAQDGKLYNQFRAVKVI